jgi:heme exporter protein D
MGLNNTTPFGCFLSFLLLGMILVVMSAINWAAVGITILAIVLLCLFIWLLNRKIIPSVKSIVANARYVRIQKARSAWKPTGRYPEEEYLTKEIYDSILAELEERAGSVAAAAKSLCIDRALVKRVKQGVFERRLLRD